jgi:NAD(P)-dependent dehydrogenase (short-subunit alcohol dehydrogenase family)
MGVLDGRVAICTGSGRGVGAEVAKLMAKEGASVIVNDPGVSGGGDGGEQGPAEAIANEIKAGGGKAAPNFGSVAIYEDCLGMVQQARDEFDGCHIIFNPAGILRDRMFHKMSPDDWQAVMDVHMNGHFNTARAAINLFREQEYGRIIMVGSTSGLLGNVGQANYGAAKLGIAGLSRIVAMENVSKNVTSNVICPSADTRMTRSVPTPKDPDAAHQREERLRLSPADAIAPLCTFLGSEDAGHVTGQIFHQRGAELSLYSQPRPLRTVHKNHGWTVETIRDKAMPSLVPHFVDIANSRNVHPGLPLE